MAVKSTTFEELEREVRAAENQVVLVTGKELSQIVGSSWTDKQQRLCAERLDVLGLLPIPAVPDHVRTPCYITRKGSAVERLANSLRAPDESNLPVVRAAAQRIDTEVEIQAAGILDKVLELAKQLDGKGR